MVSKASGDDLRVSSLASLRNNQERHAPERTGDVQAWAFQSSRPGLPPRGNPERSRLPAGAGEATAFAAECNVRYV